MDVYILEIYHLVNTQGDLSIRTLPSVPIVQVFPLYSLHYYNVNCECEEHCVVHILGGSVFMFQRRRVPINWRHLGESDCPTVCACDCTVYLLYFQLGWMWTVCVGRWTCRLCNRTSLTSLSAMLSLRLVFIMCAFTLYMYIDLSFTFSAAGISWSGQ